MRKEDAIALLGLPDEPVFTASQLRKYYLKAALLTHPDKNLADESSAARFAALQEAYNVLLQNIVTEEQRVREREHTLKIFEVLEQAFKGEDVEHALKNLGVHRPSEMFGIDLSVPFQRRKAKARELNTAELNLNEAFAEAFADDGMDEEGNPLEGWARPPDTEMDDY